MSKSALQTLRSYQTSLGNGTDEWIGLIHDEITFKDHVDAVSGKDKFIALNKAFMPMVRGYEGSCIHYPLVNRMKYFNTSFSDFFMMHYYLVAKPLNEFFKRTIRWERWHIQKNIKNVLK